MRRSSSITSADLTGRKIHKFRFNAARRNWGAAGAWTEVSAGVKPGETVVVHPRDDLPERNEVESAAPPLTPQIGSVSRLRRLDRELEAAV